jgi:hypothetical protein
MWNWKSKKISQKSKTEEEKEKILENQVRNSNI